MGKTWWRIAAPVLFWLAVWYLCAGLVGQELLLPGPGAVAAALWKLAGTAAFWRSALVSLVRVAAGFLMGAVLGDLLGVATAAWRWGDLLLSPALRGVRTVPVGSFLLLLDFWLPPGRVPVAVAALMALPVAWRSARQGIAAADPLLVELAGADRMGLWRTLRYVRFPAALPALAAGWETALGLSWKAGVAAEVLCQPKWALGTGLQASKAYLDAPGLFAWTVAVVCLSLLMEGILKALLHRWKEVGKG